MDRHLSGERQLTGISETIASRDERDGECNVRFES